MAAEAEKKFNKKADYASSGDARDKVARLVCAVGRACWACNSACEICKELKADSDVLGSRPEPTNVLVQQPRTTMARKTWNRCASRLVMRKRDAEVR
eukprot:813092-Pleurochrysis_carterae.AAC.1